MADELNIPTHRWYQTRNNIRLPKQDFSRDWIYDSGIQKIDAWINSQPWGNPVPALFEAGEQGAWYDPSDLTTLFQDTAGTTPVTTTGQSVGLMLDKSKGLVLGSEQVLRGDNEASLMGTTWQDPVLATNGTVVRSTEQASAGAASAKFTSNTASSVPHYMNFGMVPAGLSVRITGRAYLPTGSLALLVVADISDGSIIQPIVTSVKDAWVSFTITRAAKATAWPLAIGNNANEALLGAAFYLDNISIRELAGNHAVQATTVSRPIYGIHPVGGRRNLLVRTEEFENAAWSKFGATVAVNTSMAPDGTLTADTLTSTGTDPYVVQVVNSTQLAHTVSVWLRGIGSSIGKRPVLFLVRDAYAESFNSGALLPLLTSEWQRYTFTATFSAAPTSQTQARIDVVDSTPAIGDAVFIWGAQLETGSIVSPYQRVTDQYNVTEAGVSSVSYLFFDGVNDSLATPSINFATATSDGQARRNLLTFPTAFDDAVWTKLNATVTANAGFDPLGTSLADAVVEDATASAVHRVNISNITVANGSSYVFSVYAKAQAVNFLFLNAGTAFFGTNSAVFNLSTGAVVSTTGVSASIQSVGNGWYRCIVVATATSSGDSQFFINPSDNSSSAAYTGVNGRTSALLWGAQLETGTTASAFQNIGTDKMTVFAGVRLFTTASYAVVGETSANYDTNNGVITIGSTSSSVLFGSKGTLSSLPQPSQTFPVTAVLTGIGDISGDNAVLRRNGTQAAQASADQGTGTYGNYVLNVGSRNGSGSFLNGHLYSLIVRGAQSNTGQISSTETWVAGKTGIVI
jgi:hypothetical protein